MSGYLNFDAPMGHCAPALNIDQIVKDLLAERATLAEEVKQLREKEQRLVNAYLDLEAQCDGLRDVVKETANVLISGTPAIADTVWVTGDRDLTLFDMCMSALAEPKKVTP